MKQLIVATALALVAATSFAAPATVGQPAPAFTATDVNGRTVSLADFKGKHVVLEWTNPGCPFVQKHYGAGNMQSTQKDATAQGVVWLTINSSSKDSGEYTSPADMSKWMAGQKAVATTTLMDADGKLGKAYGARTTPHMYIVSPAGLLVYAGGIDNKASSNPADIPGATNYVKQAVAEAVSGKPISTPATRPYGCSVKYSSGA